jgi:hypothetical protein
MGVSKKTTRHIDRAVHNHLVSNYGLTLSTSVSKMGLSVSTFSPPAEEGSFKVIARTGIGVLRSLSIVT